LWVAIIGRILLIPVIAAVSYEVLRWGARHRESWAVRWLFLPGIWLQGITTKQPDDSMIEVAIASMREALAADHEAAPVGSLDPAVQPIPDAKVLAADVGSRTTAAAGVAAAATSSLPPPAAASAGAPTPEALQPVPDEAPPESDSPIT